MKNHKTGGANRREFIKQLAFCYAAAQIPFIFAGCENDSPSFVGTGKAPFKVWEEMLKALENSPDNIEGRIKSLTASKDPEAMFHFVRDEIYLMPTHKTSLKKIGTQLKWGLKGVVRSGFATPRGKAELLCKMYTDAGIEAKVVYERTNIQPNDVPAYFLRPIQRRFNLDVSNRQWNQWKEELHVKENSDNEIQLYDKDFKDSNALAESLWEQLPEKEKLNDYSFDFRWDNYKTPTVEFNWNGETKYAHLFDPKIMFGELKNDNGGKIYEAKPAETNKEKVSISISYRDSIDPDNEKELISGEWLSTQLIGNQINMAFLNGLNLEQQTFTPIGSLRTFTPSLAFQSFNEELKVMEENSFLGNPFTLDAKVIDLSGDEPKINGNTILKKPNQELQKRVTALIIKAFPANYPLVKLQVTPTDKNGDFVELLSNRDFFITDNKVQVQAVMESNRPTPRILILYDGSASMPKAYYQENMNAFVETLKKTILQKYPAAIINKWKTPSELFTWLLKASKTDYDLIIYATDGDNVDTYNSANLDVYKNGPPAIVLNVNDSEKEYRIETFQKMAEVSGGILLNAKDQAKTLDAIADYISKMEIPPYVFTYYAVGKEEVHEAKIGIDNNRISVKEKFKFIGNAKEEIGQCLIGLYATIKIGKTTIKRVLAGWDPLTQKKIKPDYSHYVAVRNTIYGGATVYVESEGPTLSTALSDVLKYRLSTRNWGEPLLDDDIQKAKEEFNKGGYIYHPEVMPLMAPLSEGVTTTSMTFASGIRMAIIKYKIGVGDNISTTSFDYLPTSDYATLAPSSESIFKITLQKTAQLAIREGSLFNNSTLSELKGRKLLERKEAIDKNWFSEKKEIFLNPTYWNEHLWRGDGSFKIFDKNAVSLAYWQINNDTGELYGILADGTGGASNDEIIKQLEEIMMVMSVYIAVIQKMGNLRGGGAVALSIIAAYGVTLVKLYAIASEAILIMDASGMEDKVEKALKELAVNIAYTISFGFYGVRGAIMDGLRSLVDRLGLNSNPYSK